MKKILIISLLLFTLCGCNAKADNRESEVKQSEIKQSEIKQSNSIPLAATGKYLFNADKMETVEISGDDLLKRRKVEMSIKDTWKKEKKWEDITLEIKRDKYGLSTSMNFFSDSSGADFLSGLGETLDEWSAGPKKGFYYQLAVYDFNRDGKKEIIVAGGNKQDILELSVFRFNPKQTGGRNNPKSLAYHVIKGGYKSYVNEKKDICVIDNSGNNVAVYPYKDN